MSVSSANPPIAVIGAGFSGTMAALHLLARTDRVILLCERNEGFGRGVAYSTADPGHVLNVRALNMSAFPDRPGHFLEWLRTATVRPEQVHVTEAGTFVSRAVYGNYLTELLSAAVTGPEGASRLILVPDEVVDLVPETGGYSLVLAGGNSHAVAAAVLAVGNLLPTAEGQKAYVANPWATPFTKGLEPNRPVVVIGTGLTMVDVALELRRAGFSGPVIAISRHGLLSHTHANAAGAAWPTPRLTDRERASPAQLLRRLRREVEVAARQGIAWQSVVDSLRPITAELWRHFPDTAQDSFIRHARPWWDIHRHRTAPSVGKALDTMLKSGFLSIRTGHIADLRVHGDGADVELRPRGAAETVTIAGQRVINAAGAAPPDKCDVPLMEQLIARGLVRPNRHGLGLDLSQDLMVIDSNGNPAPRFRALGPIGAGSFWECIAVPDIRGQAARLADDLAATLAADGRSGDEAKQRSDSL